MAGRIRQPINLENLEKYIKQYVPEIAVPLDVKQVSTLQSKHTTISIDVEVVRLWTIKPNILVDSVRRQQICHAKEAAREAGIEDGASSRSRVSDNTRHARYRCPGAESNVPLRRR